MINTVEEFVRLCTSDLPEDQLRAKIEETTEEVLIGVIEECPYLVTSVIRSNSVTLSILAELARSPDQDIRFDVAMKRKLTPDLIEYLSQDEDETVRQRIAYNAKTPRRILAMLANDKSTIVAAAALARLEKQS